MRAYSMDLRLRVVEDCDAGMKPSAVASKYRVSTRWVQKLLKRRQETGEISARRGKTGPKPRWLPHVEAIQSLVEQNSDATLEEFVVIFDKQLGLRYSVHAIWTIFKKLGISLKKSPACGGTRSYRCATTTQTMAASSA